MIKVNIKYTLFAVMSLSLFIFGVYSYSQSEHNEPNQAFTQGLNGALRNGGIYVYCYSNRTGRYVAQNGIVTPPEQWTFNCFKNLNVRWEPMLVNGEPAASYRFVYYTHTRNLQEIRTTDTNVTLPLADPSGYEMFVEGYDSTETYSNMTTEVTFH